MIDMRDTFRCGHPRTPKNTRTRVDRGNAYAYCRECARARNAAYYRRTKVFTNHQKAMREQWARAGDIVLRTAQATGSSIDFLMSGERWREVVRPKQAAMLTMRRMGMSYPRIGLMFGNDHSTVIHGCKVAAQRETSDPAYAALIARIAAGRVERWA